MPTCTFISYLFVLLFHPSCYGWITSKVNSKGKWIPKSLKSMSMCVGMNLQRSQALNAVKLNVTIAIFLVHHILIIMYIRECVYKIFDLT